MLEEVIQRIVFAPDYLYISCAIWAISSLLSRTAILPIGIGEDGVRVEPEDKVFLTLYPLVWEHLFGVPDMPWHIWDLLETRLIFGIESFIEHIGRCRLT